MRFNIFVIVNALLQSNTYILWREHDTQCWVIDPGDIEPMVAFFDQKSLTPQGILITHYHFDHIYGTNELRTHYGNIPIYCGADTKLGLLNSKINMSRYSDNPFVVQNISIMIVEGNSQIKLWNDIHAQAHYTPGHNDDCFSFSIDNTLFTGDALIPNTKVHTKSQKADKHIAQQTIDMILDKFDPNTTIYPGHKKSCTISEIK